MTNQPLAPVDSFTYLDIDVADAKTFGDQTPVPLPDYETRTFHIIPQKIVFADNSIWENTANQPFVLADYEQKRISSLGELADQYKRDLHDICSKASAHTYLPARKNGFTICGCGKIMLDSTKICPACGVAIDRLFALDDIDLLSTADNKYKQEQIRKEKLQTEKVQTAENARLQKITKQKNLLMRCAMFGIPLLLIISLFTGIHIHHTLRYKNAANHVAAGYGYTAIINSNNRVQIVGNTERIEPIALEMNAIKPIALSATDEELAILKSDGDILGTQQEATAYKSGTKVTISFDVVKTPWNCTSIAQGASHTLGLTSAGTVLSYGYNRKSECDVDHWTHISQISAGSLFSVGLANDGTCIATGDNAYNQCNVSNWSEIKEIATGASHTVGLKKNGTVVATGNNKYGQCDVSDWTNIEFIAAGMWDTIGIKKDGTVIATGNNNNGQCNVQDWSDIIAVSAGVSHTVGIKKDGTLVATGKNDDGQCNVDGIKLW